MAILAGELGGERLELREEQAQCVRKKGNEAEQKVLAALALLGEVILDQCQLKLKENQDVGSIAEVAVLKINEANEILELYRLIFGFPETPNGTELKMKQETETNGEM